MPRVAVSMAFLRPSRPRVAILKVKRVVPCVLEGGGEGEREGEEERLCG
jgi:hypothetical protein